MIMFEKNLGQNDLKYNFDLHFYTFLRIVFS